MKSPKLVLLIILLIGTFVRIQGVLTKSFAFTYDVGRDMIALSEITHLVHFPFIGPTTGIPGVFYGPWWYYLLSPFFILFNGDPQGIALVMTAIGIATIYLGYLLGKKIDGEFLGLTFASIISVSSIMISLSSQIWNPNIAPLFGILTLITVFKLYKDKTVAKVWYLALGILLALSMDIELFYGVMFSFGIIASIVINKGIRFSLKQIASFLFGALIIFAPRILFEFKNDFLMTKSLIMFFQRDSQKIGLFEYIPKRVDTFLSHISETLTHSDKTLGIILIFLSLFVVLFYFKKAAETEKKFLKTVAIVFVSFFFGTLMFGQDIWPHYLVGLPIFYILFLAIGLNLLRKNLNKYISIAALLVILFLNFNPILEISNLRKPLWEGNAAVYRNQLAVVDYVYGQAKGDKFKYVVYTPTVNDYVYKYLFMWYGPKYHGYSPSERATKAFFILEPDPDLPGRQTRWLDYRQGDGDIIKTEKIKGGIVVQTRLTK